MDNLIRIQEAIHTGFKVKEYTVAVLLDIKKAYDNVNRTILLQDLTDLINDERIISWFVVRSENPGGHLGVHTINIPYPLDNILGCWSNSLLVSRSPVSFEVQPRIAPGGVLRGQ